MRHSSESRPRQRWCSENRLTPLARDPNVDPGPPPPPSPLCDVRADERGGRGLSLLPPVRCFPLGIAVQEAPDPVAEGGSPCRRVRWGAEGSAEGSRGVRPDAEGPKEGSEDGSGALLGRGSAGDGEPRDSPETAPVTVSGDGAPSGESETPPAAEFRRLSGSISDISISESWTGGGEVVSGADGVLVWGSVKDPGGDSHSS